MPKVMEVAIGRKTKVAIYGNDYNTKDVYRVRDHVHVSDLAKAHVDSINYISISNKNLTVNL